MATPSLSRPQAGDHAPYFSRYVDLVPPGDILEMLGAQARETSAYLAALPEARGSHRYAPGKWSIKEVFGHLIDTERVFGYRAMRFARGDTTPLPGFEQDDWINTGGFDARTVASYREEFDAVRRATLVFFKSLDAVALERMGTASGNSIRVRAIPYLMAGHERHHMAILKERYG